MNESIIFEAGISSKSHIYFNYWPADLIRDKEEILRKVTQ